LKPCKKQGITGYKMSERKNVDRVFQEKLKDFEVTPPEFVWDNIREALEEKKKRRAVPIWFRYSGVAAGLVAGAFFGWQYLSDNSAIPTVKPAGNGVVVNPVGTEGKKNIDPDKVVTPGAVEGTPGNVNTLSGNPSSLVSTDDAADNNNAASAEKNNRKQTLKHKGSNTATLQSEGEVVYNNNANTEDKAHRRASGRNLRKRTAHGGVQNLNADHGSSATKSAHSNRMFPAYAQEAVATAKPGRHTQKGKSTLTTNQDIINSSVVGNDKTKRTGVASGNPMGTVVSPENNTALTANENTPMQGRANAGSAVIDKDTPVATPETAVTEVNVVPVTDTVKPVQENELEKLLREQEQSKKEQLAESGKAPKWNVKPQVAPVFYGSLSGGSPIDAQFASNAKNYDKDLSYGLGVNYAVNSRISIRTGVNTVNLNYATQDIQFYASLNGATSNVARSSKNANIVVTTRTEGSSVVAGLAAAAGKESYSGAMVQTTGYVEVPLEMSYALLRKKFGIQVIGGFSTLFLNQNNVSVISTQGLATDVGEAQNLNNVHFSTNVGLGFKYRIFKSLEANFEPTFKYQVNTYSRDAGTFKPYFIGLYSGVSFSF